MRLKNKIAIITGSGRGIGKAIVLEMAKQGANVIISDINLEECQKVCKEVEKIGSKALAVKCDVSNEKEVKDLIKKTINKFGRIDILVNNAGIFKQIPIEEMTEKDLGLVLDINLKGYFLCTREAVKYMKKQKRGKIINISSIAGEVGFLNSSAYCASKGGIIAMTKELALELGQYRINVNAVGPGVVETPMTKGMLENPETKKALLANIPLCRVCQPEEIGKAAVFLASDEADYITGHCLFVDGGWLSR